MRRIVSWVCLLAIIFLADLQLNGQVAPPAQVVKPQRPFAEIRHVLIMSVDGMRPDLLLRGGTPNMHKLFANGSYSFWARSTELSITLPSHTSMLTGVTPEKHGITWNDDSQLDVYPKYPSILDLAHQAGYTTSLVTGKSKLAVLVRPGNADFLSVPKQGQREDDTAVAQHAAQIIRRDKPEVMMIHFGDNDKLGHAIGWGTPEQMAVLAIADKGIGQVLQALDDAGLTGETLIILTADHGGTGRWHGPNDPRARHIPWIASGPRIRKGLDLTTDRDLTINIEDTFGTAAFALGIKPEMPVDGKPVMRIFQMDELVVPASK